MGIAAAFDRAADYDAHADVQRRVAARLADDILELTGGGAARVLEVGCGTGFLGRALAGRLAFDDYLATDIAPAMVARAAANLTDTAGMHFAVMDAAAPVERGRFDLVCSSLAMQWIDDLPTALVRLRALLAPGGLLVFTTLAAGSLDGWRAAHGPHRSGTPDYPAPDALRALGLDVTVAPLTQSYSDAHAFLRALKGIGAATPRAGHRPLSPAALRAAMARFEQAGASVTYQVATCRVRVGRA